MILNYVLRTFNRNVYFDNFLKSVFKISLHLMKIRLNYRDCLILESFFNIRLWCFELYISKFLLNVLQRCTYLIVIYDHVPTAHHRYALSCTKT